VKIIKKQFDWNDIESQKLFVNATNEFEIEERYVSEAKNLISILNINLEDKVLDFACGNGKHAIELAKLDYKIQGYDNSDYYIERACRIANKHNVDVKFYNNVEDIKSSIDKYDYIYTIRFPISYFNRKDLIISFKIIYQLLKGNGRFLLGFPFTREKREKKFPSNSWKEEEGIFYLSDKKINADGKKVERYIEINPKEEMLTEWIDECKDYYLEEIKEILQDINFIPIKFYKNLSGDTSKEADKIQFILCKKNNK